MQSDCWMMVAITCPTPGFVRSVTVTLSSVMSITVYSDTAVHVLEARCLLMCLPTSSMRTVRSCSHPVMDARNVSIIRLVAVFSLDIYIISSTLPIASFSVSLTWTRVFLYRTCLCSCQSTRSASNGSPAHMVLNYPDFDPVNPVEWVGMREHNSGMDKPTGRGLHNHLFVKSLRGMAAWRTRSVT